MADLITTFSQAASEAGERTALVDRFGRISFAGLDRRAQGFAQRCTASGIGRGDRVLIAMPVGVELYVALAGLWRLGAVAVFPEPALGLAGLRHAIATTRPKAFVAAGLYRGLKFLLPALWTCRMLTPDEGGDAHCVPTALKADDTALISYTSGSTGPPKAIPRSHGFLMAQHEAVAPLLVSPRAETDLVGFPVFALVNLAAGRTSVLPNWRLSRPDKVTAAALAELIEFTGCTRALLPPSLCATLKNGPTTGLHTVFTGGGPVKPDLVEALRARPEGLRVVSVYGSTEAEPIAELDWSDVAKTDFQAMRGGAGLLAGKPVAGLDLRLVDDEIQVAGPHVNEGYLDPDMDRDMKVREGGAIWHRTGDAGRLDPSGRLWLLGRHSAIADGPDGRIFPFAVELAAESWPGVQRAALWNDGDSPTLVLEGDDIDLDDCAAQAKALGLTKVVQITRIPLDRRHHSKIDYTALGRKLR